MGAAGRTGVATAALWAALSGAAMASTPATVITDPTGDANGLATLGVEQATGPASDGSRDLTAVKLSTEGDALQVVFEQAAPPDLDKGISTANRFNATIGKCPVSLTVVYSGDPVQGRGAPWTLVEGANCAPGWTFVSDKNVTIEGSKLVARFAFADLAKAGVPVTTGSRLTNLSADTRLGTYYSVAIGCSPDPCPPQIYDAFHAIPQGPYSYVDRAAGSGDYTVSSDRRRGATGRTGRR